MAAVDHSLTCHRRNSGHPAFPGYGRCIIASGNYTLLRCPADYSAGIPGTGNRSLIIAVFYLAALHRPGNPGHHSVLLCRGDGCLIPAS